nr:gem-associated protein 6 [Nothobranchius furzeri]
MFYLNNGCCFRQLSTEAVYGSAQNFKGGCGTILDLSCFFRKETHKQAPAFRGLCRAQARTFCFHLTVMQRGWLHSGPLLWLQYVDKNVKLKVGKHEEHRGWLLTVDPVSASVVLVNFREDGASVRVVMGHAVEDVEVLQESDPETAERLRLFLLPPTTSSLDPEELSRRRMGVYRWLEKNRVPVEEDGDSLRVAGALTILAPYRPEDCCSSNQIILDRIQRLIQSQPHLLKVDPGFDSIQILPGFSGSQEL